MYSFKKKPKTTETVVQQKTNQGFQIQDNRSKTVSTITQLAATDVIQKKGDKYYWVVKAGSKIYVGKFKNHKTANKWWAKNKSSYKGYTFGQGSSAKKYR